MKKHFYTHIVETSSISLAIAEMDMTHDERKHLLSLVEENLHHAILDAVLSELSEKDKQEFIELFAQGEDEKVWKLLRERVGNIEDKIKKTADDLKKELHKDIEDSKK
jgi:5,10-methenyltetrahydromethanopterin hydrogenase